MISSAEAMRDGLPWSRSHGWTKPGMRRFETENPVTPALLRAPRPVAASSRISPPEPVAAPGNGEIAVGWLCVSTFIKISTRPASAEYRRVRGSGTNQLASCPRMTAALSRYADSTSPGWCACVWRIISNNDRSCSTPSMVHDALKILWRQCSEFTCANIISSMSVGSRPSSPNRVRR